ncbi:transcription factor E2F [Tritrichomonas foetus]|uniref:Transcription factor E2F n=1 Tax=Tritrichomonas foetus TaxID=1144522 RepID=A0A1J4KPY9_9EUKA|nr:transcription factor E2F [Tritrichomonas foetus]|eukprot:OHT13178.1 transcription factor E2F [Tritrichomonas foetus]
MSQNADKEKRTLVTLTQDFLNVLTSSEGKEVDLSQCENDLGVSKRRLYDVTNVLAGIGVVERSGKAKVKWIGCGKSKDEMSMIQEYTEKEAELDKMISFIDQQLESISTSSELAEHGWVSYDDILTLAQNPGMCMYSLKGPTNLTILAPEGENGEHHLVCTSPNGGIDLVQIKPT